MMFSDRKAIRPAGGTSPPDPLGYLKREEEQRFIREVLQL